MKYLITTILALMMGAMTMNLSGADKDKQNHSLVKLWETYYSAERADKPQDQLKALDAIKKEASERKLAWDYYDACSKYVEVRSSMNWKQRAEANEQKNKEIEQFGEPIAVFVNRIGENTDKSIEYIKQKKSELKAAHNPEFYSGFLSRYGRSYMPAVTGLLDNDYDFCLWVIHMRDTRTGTTDFLSAEFKGRYPYAEFIEFDSLSRTDDKPLKEYSAKYKGKAVALLADQDLLNRKFSDLQDKSKGKSADFLALREDCRSFIATRRKFTGSEKTIADCCTNPDDIIRTLEDESLYFRVKDDVANITVRNLSSVSIKVLRDKKTVFSTSVSNPAGSFYAEDELTAALPLTEDGDYTVICSSGELKEESEYARYSLSLAYRYDSEGCAVYVADYRSGKPVESYDIELVDNDGKVLRTQTGMSGQGFVRLPSGFTEKTTGRKTVRLRASTTDAAGHRLLSDDGSVYSEPYFSSPSDNEGATDRHCYVITDKGAFNPGETVHFKAVFYNGRYGFKVYPEGVKVKAVLYDPEMKEVASNELVTNGFGSVAGDFVLREGGRGGIYYIQMEENDRTVGSATIRVDEFVLPTFELVWDKSDRIYLPGDEINVSGRIKSYSGNNLSTARIRYSVVSASTTVASGNLTPEKDGSFSIRFKASGSEYSFYRITVTAIDATGESLQYSTSTESSSTIPVNIEVDGTANGRYSEAGNDESYEYFIRSRSEIVSAERLDVTFSAEGYSIHAGQHPGLSIVWKLRSGERIIRSGNATSGESVSMDLSDLPSGLYSIDAEASATGGDGERRSGSDSFSFIKAADTDNFLNMDVKSFFKELSGDGIGLQIGCTTGPVWAVVELFGNGNVRLDQQIVRLEGIKGKVGSLKAVHYDARESWPENLTLKVLYFKDGEEFSYSCSKLVKKEKEEMPLQFTRFLDTTAPGAEYTFNIQTAAGVECAATVFDKSSETVKSNVWRTISPSVKQLPTVSYSTFCGRRRTEQPVYTTRRMVMSKAAGAVMANDAMMLDSVEEEVMVAGYVAEEPNAGEGLAEELRIREDFATTIAWEPFLRSDDDGQISFSFRNADKLSTYYVQLFAHDKQFHNATIRREMIVTVPVQIALVQPQFLREGDRYVAKVSVSNNQDTDVSGKISINFYNGKDYRNAPAIGRKTAEITVPAGGNADFSFEMQTPPAGELGLLVSFTPDNLSDGSDGVFVVIPVKPATQLITEAHSSILLAGDDREALISKLRGMFVNVSGSDAAVREISILDMLMEAIPERSVPGSDNVLSQTEAMYANVLISELRKTGYVPDGKLVEKIGACRNSDGGFGWFPGFSSSPILTAAVLERFAKMRDRLPSELEGLVADAVKYLDGAFLGRNARPIWCGGISMEQYLHVRARYSDVEFGFGDIPAKQASSIRKAIKKYLVPSGARNLNGMIFDKARRLQTLESLLSGENGTGLAKQWGISFGTARKLGKSLAADVESLVQYAQPHKSGGIYYPNAVMPWRGLLESELYAHTLLCELMDAHGHSDIAEGIRLWAMVQKETQQWGDDPAYIEALGAVLHGSEATLQTRVIALSASVEKPFGEIVAAGNGFTVKRRYFRDGKELAEGEKLNVGDKITARYEIWNEENRSFVRLTAPRAASLRPAQQLSGNYGWMAKPLNVDGWVAFTPNGYRNVLADKTEYWFDSYPEENTVITEDFLVTQEGTFSVPVVEIESLYAPHYRANGEGGAAIISE